MNSSGAVGDILVSTFVNLRDNIVYTENRKYMNGSGSCKKTLLVVEQFLYGRHPAIHHVNIFGGWVRSNQLLCLKMTLFLSNN